MIYTKKIVTSDSGEKLYEVRTIGHNFLISRDELKREIKNGAVYFKANKPVALKDI